MQSLSNEILQNFQVRKTYQQKSEFIEFLSSNLLKSKINLSEERSGKILKTRNLVIGDVENAKVIYTAHYDTAPKMPVPNFVTPRNLFVTVLYQLLLLIPFFFIGFFTGFTAMYISDNAFIANLINLIVVFILIYLLMFGKANKHTANDNTSGVITLIEIMLSMSEEQRNKTAFVFFDNEEVGLVGSSKFAKKNSKILKDKLIINFDCVSDGKNMLFVASGKARKSYGELLPKAYSDDDSREIKALISKASTTFYPSDQMNFPVGVGVAALKRKKGIGLYLDKIHTSKDVVFERENIEYLREKTLKFTDLL